MKNNYRMSTFGDRFLDVWSETYVQKLMFKLAMVLLIIGGLNWLLVGLFDMNLVSGIFGKGIVATLIYFLVGLSAIFIIFDRNTYLPFLGPIVAPCSVLENRDPPGATREVKVVVEPNVKILYWAAEPASEKLEKLNSWKQAYLDYQNAGVTTSNGEGVAVFKVRDPQPYKVPFKGRLEPHVHYRVCGEAGWMGEIKTVYVNQNKVEGFENNKTDKNFKIVNLADTSSSLY
jgi:uncharacterized membrane protein YuzA (DUF378 family)